MNEPTKYAYSTDQECYIGSFDSPLEAVAEAFGEDEDLENVWIGVCVTPDPLHHITGEDVIEQILCQEDFSAEWAENALSHTKEQGADLSEMLREAFDGWMKKHNITVGFFNIEHPEEWSRERFEAEFNPHVKTP